MRADRLLLALVAPLALVACGKAEAPRQSLVGDFAAPGDYAIAGDTLTVWKRVQQPGGAWRFHSWSITPGGSIEYLEELERVGAPENPEEAQDFSEQRRSFTLPQAEFEALRAQAALLRPHALGPEDPVGGYAGEVYPAGCSFDPARPRVAGINFLNGKSWGNFALQDGCVSDKAREATEVITQIFDRLTRATPPPKAPRR
ncbi:hypothetical protein [Novosphingobium sp. JCM 18896]|uniref:hypothetical protein n=1 Tax=Novosphingobium sp. JCM 18896 TaxID=2989731 RepID=UPI002222D2C1|nr:hypothetical protein [Novosphingobium sp. JCM 18896]MCW1429545.1 hypothetical protein [Novosphingobium sp. JCM 18896]